MTNTYLSGNSPIHRLDARVKVVLLAIYSITLFLVDTWAGLLVCGVFFVLAYALAGISLRHVAGLMIPVFVLATFTILFNSFSLDVSQANNLFVPLWGENTLGGGFGVPLPLMGSFGFVPAGFDRGCFFALRILLLVVASIVISLTTTSTDLTAALNDFLRPLRVAHVPTDDIAMIFSLTLRFIPVTAEEFGRVYNAQWSRGASFDQGRLWRRLRAWQTVFIPLFIRLFRRADTLSIALDARCYGAQKKRSSLAERSFTIGSFVLIVGGVSLCVALAVWF